MKKHYRNLTTFTILAVLLGFTVATWSDAGEGQELTGQSDSWDAYKIIVERNMFSRQRGPRVDRSNREGRTRTPPPAPNPESYYVLKGVVEENGVFIAFLEDTQRGQILRVCKGDKVVRGAITDMTLDSIEYQFEDRTVTVAMGYDLEGGQGTVTFAQMYELSQAYSSTSEEGTTESSTPPSADEAEILKQLMERRQQQVGQ